MVLRLAAPVLAGLALVCWLAGVVGFASLALLAAIVVASAWLLAAVGDAAEGHGHRRHVVLSVAGLVCLVAAGATNLPLFALGLFPCVGLELLDSAAARPAADEKPVELLDAPVSRAA